MKHLIVVILMAVMIPGCTKEIKLEDIGNEPVIEFRGISPLEVENFNNSINLTIGYHDVNGDLGYSDPDVYALWVKDSRLDSADWYHIPPLAPLGQEIRIEGELNIVLNSMFIIGNGNEELVSLAVKLRDRSNNWSNIVYTPYISVKKP